MNIENNSAITLTKDIKNLISSSQETAIRAIDTGRVVLYWNIGKRIVEELQEGKERADYGKGIIKNLSSDLIKSVYIGCKAKKETIDYIENLKTQKQWEHLDIYHMSIDEEEYKLNKTKL